MSNYTAIPTEELENWQEVREMEILSGKTRQNREARMRKEAEEAKVRQAEEDSKREWEANQARIRELEDEARQERIAEMQRLAWMAFIWVAGCALLIILAKTGAIIDPVMQVGTTALSFALGCMVGKTVN